MKYTLIYLAVISVISIIVTVYDKIISKKKTQSIRTLKIKPAFILISSFKPKAREKGI